MERWEQLRWAGFPDTSRIWTTGLTVMPSMTLPTGATHGQHAPMTPLAQGPEVLAPGIGAQLPHGQLTAGPDADP